MKVVSQVIWAGSWAGFIFPLSVACFAAALSHKATGSELRELLQQAAVSIVTRSVTKTLSRLEGVLPMGYI